MDGVLIDVTLSYREVTRLSVIYYLRDVVGAHIPKNTFLTLSDIAAIKKSGGLNNDWDLTYAIINSYLRQALKNIDPCIKEKLKQLGEIGDDAGALKAFQQIVRGCDLSTLEKLLTLGNARELCINGGGQEGGDSPFLLNHRDVLSGNIVKRIFQEIYLGKVLFEEIYGSRPIFFHKNGYLARESLIPSLDQLGRLSRTYTLSIATGRPAVEARYALKYFKIVDLFKTVVSEDDIVAAENKAAETLRKPHPFSLKLCVEKSGYSLNSRFYYIGDMPDDMTAATRAGMIPIGFVNKNTNDSIQEQEEHKGLLWECGAREVFGEFGQIIDYLEEPEKNI
jgi:phosphoglycolate phosphatase-like HAD superfamily hydrolase